MVGDSPHSIYRSLLYVVRVALDDPRTFMMVRYRNDDSDGDSTILLTPATQSTRQNRSNKKKCYCAILSCVGTLIVLVAVATIVLIAFHAQCKITW